MEQSIVGSNITWARRALCAALVLLPLWLSGCADDKKTDPPPTNTFDLTVSLTGSGQVTSSPAGIDCGSDCAETLAAESSVTLSATPASGAMFTGWGGDCSGSTPSCTLTMSASRAVTATFTTDPPPPAAQYTLTVSVTGNGSVSSSPTGILCPGDCTETLVAGSSIILSATPASGFTFSGWSGSDISCPGTGTCTVSMTVARSVTATFSQIAATNYALTVSLAGSGSVSSSPAGINCGTDCAENYAAGTSVILTATSGMGSTFSGWSGSGISCAGTGTCTVSMTAARSVTATFTTSASISISITAPVSTGSYTATSTPLTIGGTTTGSVSQVTWVNGSSNGIATGTGTWSVAGIALQAGTNTITVTAHASGGGSTASASLVVTYGTATSTTYYLSPTGSNTANGTSISTPWKTFAHAFSSTNMKAGDELILLDGLYSAAAGIGTGVISALGTGSGQPPSGTGINNVTRVRALKPGSVTIAGGLFIGGGEGSTPHRKDSFITIQGITFDGNSNGGEGGGGSLYNTSYVTIKDCGFHGGLGVGTNDHHQFNDNNLIEDVWIWASGVRVIAINYRSHNNVWRRVVVRGDGCGLSSCSGSGNPNVGITVYESNNISFQNVMVVDRILAATDSGYADFAVAQHDSDASGACVGCYTFGNNEWLGTISINAPDIGYYMEPDHYTAALVLPPSMPTITLRNAVAWKSNSLGFNLRRNIPNGRFENLLASPQAGSEGGITGIAVQTDFSVYTPASITNTVHNSLVVGARSNGVYANTGTGISANANSPSNVTVSNAAVFGMGSAYSLKGGTCTACVTNIDPLGGTIPSLLYLTRIETGSPLKGAGLGGADIGATVLNRYGADGTRYGDANYNTLTSTALWPWPNEARIKQEMCVGAGVTRGFCSTGTRRDMVNPVTLTSYIWEQLGNPIPSGIYPPPPP